MLHVLMTLTLAFFPPGSSGDKLPSGATERSNADAAANDHPPQILAPMNTAAAQNVSNGPPLSAEPAAPPVGTHLPINPELRRSAELVVRSAHGSSPPATHTIRLGTNDLLVEVVQGRDGPYGIVTNLKDPSAEPIYTQPDWQPDAGERVGQSQGRLHDVVNSEHIFSEPSAPSGLRVSNIYTAIRLAPAEPSSSSSSHPSSMGGPPRAARGEMNPREEVMRARLNLIETELANTRADIQSAEAMRDGHQAWMSNVQEHVEERVRQHMTDQMNAGKEPERFMSWRYVRGPEGEYSLREVPVLQKLPQELQAEVRAWKETQLKDLPKAIKALNKDIEKFRSKQAAQTKEKAALEKKIAKQFPPRK